MRLGEKSLVVLQKHDELICFIQMRPSITLKSKTFLSEANLTPQDLLDDHQAASFFAGTSRDSEKQS